MAKKKKSPLDRYFPTPAVQKQFKVVEEKTVKGLVFDEPKEETVFVHIPVPVLVPASVFKCGACGGKLVPSKCGCLTEGCVNHVSKWPRPGTMYAAPR